MLHNVGHFNELRGAVGREAPTIKMHIVSDFVGVDDDFHRVEYAEYITFAFQTLLTALYNKPCGVVVVCLLLDLFALAFFVVNSSNFFSAACRFALQV